MTPKPAAPSPFLIFDTIMAQQRTSALRASIELKLYTAIAQGAHTVEALAAACQASTKGLRVLCDFLTVAGFLTKSDDGYGLTSDSEFFLVEGSPAFVGGAMAFLFHPQIERGFSHVLEAVRKGGTVLPEEGTVSYDNPVWVDFARGMGPMMMPAGNLIAGLTAGSGPLKVLDIAAGHGMFGILIAQRNPEAEIYALDWKNVLAVAHENAVKLGVADRWHAVEGSAFTTDFGSGYDVVLVTNFIHHFDFPTNVALIEKLQAAMKPGGTMAILESVVNDDRVTPAGAATFAMTMLTTTAAGDVYSFREIEAMCAEAGLPQVSHHSVPGAPHTITLAKM
jgi:2-polyprenyl-3-methyl-5-hydroxy-6-metoxy-1,4-benzoquinol methylase